MHESSPVRVAVLGPIEVRDAIGLPVRTPRARVRALLAALAIEQGHTVSRDRLIDVLWGECPPPAAATSLHSYVSQLRRALADSAAVVGEGGGYRLEIDAGLVDAARFEQLATEGKAAVAGGDLHQAMALLEAALGLWRGRAYGEFADEDPFRTEADRLAEARLAVVEDRLDVRLGLGDHTTVVGEVESLLVDHPLRERLWARLLTALYRCGRQADALAAYQRIRNRLVNELGLEPGDELQQLEQLILVHDPSLDYRPAPAATKHPPVTAPPPQDVTVLVGRQTELAVATQLLEKAMTGRGQVLLVAGEAGIGKTSLCERIVGEANALGFTVMVGRCLEGAGAPPLWPWIQVLRGVAEHVTPAQLRLDVIGPGAADMVALEPRLARLLGNPPPLPVADDGARFRQFDAFTCLMQESARTRPLAIVLDDVHRADAASLQLLQFLANAITRDPILVVAAHRDTPAERTEVLRDTLAELARTGGTSRVQLAGLNEEEVGVLIGARKGSPATPNLAGAVHRQTDGNPFFVTEVIRCLGADATAVASSPPATVRDVIVARVSKLSGAAIHALRAASVLGRRFHSTTLELTSDLTTDQLAVALDESAAANLVVTEGADQWRFVHALVAEALYAELTRGRRVGLHRRAAEAIEKTQSHELELHLAELAHHHRQAATSGHGAEAVRYSILAGDHAMSLYGYQAAIASYQHALDALDLDPPTDPIERAEVLIRLGEANRDLGRFDAAEEALMGGAEAARAVGDTDLMARAVLGLSWVKEQGGIDQRRIGLLEDLLDQLPPGDSETRARALIALTSELLFAHCPERYQALAREAVAMARQLDDADLLAEAVATAVMALFPRNQFDEAMELAIELRELIAAGATIRQHLLDALPMIIDLVRGDGDAAMVETEIRRCHERAAEQRRPYWSWMALNLSTMQALMIGDLQATLARYSEAAAAGQLLDNPNTRMTAQGQLLWLGMEYGFPSGSELALMQLIEQTPPTPALNAFSALVHALQGDLNEAQAQLEAVADDGFAPLAGDMYWIFATFWASLACTRIGNRKWAEALYHHLAPQAHRCAASIAPALWYGPIAWPLGELAALLERWDASETHFAQALAANERMGAQPSIVRVKVSWADMLEHRRRTGDADGAVQLYADAQAIVNRLELPQVDRRPSAWWPTG